MTDATETSAPTTTHRDRLLGGMAAAVREKGFRRTTVADVVRHARVSRRTFYEQFEDLVECYLALAALLGDHIHDAIRAAAEDAKDLPLDERLAAAVDGYLKLLGADPALTRSYALESHLAGERGHLQLQSATERVAQLIVDLIDDARRDDPALNPVTLETAIILVAGIRELAMRAQERDLPLREVRSAAAGLLRAALTAPAAAR